MNYEMEILNLKKRIEYLESVILNQNHEQKAEPSIGRDKTKYLFEGKICPKNRLVLLIVKNYVKQNNPTYEELCETFDKSLQGSLGVVELYENALKISDGAKRFFLKDEDIINLKDEKVVVCTQWGIFNIVKFIKRAEALGFKIDTI